MTSCIPAGRTDRATDRTGDERQRRDRPHERSLDAADACATDLRFGYAERAVAGGLGARQARTDLARGDVPVEERTKRAPLLLR
jgi:hypothetical protein